MPIQIRSRGLWEKMVKPAVDLITLVVSLLSLTSIWVAIHEMRVNEETASISSYQTIESLAVELDKMLVEHPDLVPYFLNGKADDPKCANYNQIIAVADARIGAIDAMLTYAKYKHAEDSIVGWKNTFVRYFQRSPVMCERLTANERDYGLIVQIGKTACGGAR
jgi:hypothetical protein